MSDVRREAAGSVRECVYLALIVLVLIDLWVLGSIVHDDRADPPATSMVRVNTTALSMPAPSDQPNLAVACPHT